MHDLSDIKRRVPDLLNLIPDEAWQRKHFEVFAAYEAEEQVAGACNIARLVTWIAESVEKQAARDALTDFFSAGDSIRSLLTRVIELGRESQSLIDEWEERGYPCERTAELSERLSAAETVYDRFVSTWPVLDEQMIEDSLADHEAGRSRTPKEILDELCRVCPAEG